MAKLTKEEQKKIANEHIRILFAEAKEIFPTKPTLANRYIKIALNIRNKIKVQFTKEQKAHFCKKCHKYLMPGKNCTVRTKNKTILYHCKECGNIRRFVSKK